MRYSVKFNGIDLFTFLSVVYSSHWFGFLFRTIKIQYGDVFIFAPFIQSRNTNVLECDRMKCMGFVLYHALITTRFYAFIVAFLVWFLSMVCAYVCVCMFPFKLHTLQYDAASHIQYKNWLSFSLHDTESSFIFHCKFFFLSFLNKYWDGMDFHIRYDHCDRKMYQYWLRYKWTERYHKIKIVT